jgi:hypothetical protein
MREGEGGMSNYLKKERCLGDMAVGLGVALLGLLSLACGGGAGGGLDFRPTYTSSEASPVFEEETLALQKSMTSLPSVEAQSWNEKRVRKVLHLFAFGSTVSPEKIDQWASMDPQEAIEEMISLNAINPNFLKAEEGIPYINGELTELSKVWSSQSDTPEKSKYDLDRGNSPAEVWLKAARSPFLNPVRQRVGLLETNDHMAVNLDAAVTTRQVFRYYDTIMNTLAQGDSYEKVLNKAALSAAIATQYNHRENRFEDGVFRGNEDFAREYHQLFFGILGSGDSDVHENVTIRNTAKALTDIRVERMEVSSGTVLSDLPMVGMEYHYPSSLEILNNPISGGNAVEKISQLSEEAIQNEESIKNLPILLVKKLADPTPSDNTMDRVEKAWRDLPTKSLLAFLRSYATSDAFHSSDRFKPWTVLERRLIIANRLQITQEERDAYAMVSPWELLQLENAPFRPIHDVFGGLRGEEALASSHRFAKAWEDSTRNVWRYTRSQDKKKDWRKDWSEVIPSHEGEHVVLNVAEFLWKRFIGDDTQNFGLLERAQVYSLLASGRDYGLRFDEENPERSYGEEDLSTEGHQSFMNDLSVSRINFDHENDYRRRQANERVGLAVAFIVMTPYMFGQEG